MILITLFWPQRLGSRTFSISSGSGFGFGVPQYHQGKACNTLTVSLSVFIAFRGRFSKASVPSAPGFCYFFQGVLRLRLHVHHPVPCWDLDLFFIGCFQCVAVSGHGGFGSVGSHDCILLAFT